MCAPPDCAERLAEVGVPLAPFGLPVRSLVHAATAPSAADVPRRAAELTAAAFDKIAMAAEGCDALVASGLMPAVAAARSVAQKLDIRSVFVSYCPIFLPSPYHRPFPLPGRPLPPDVTDHQVLDDLDVRSYNAVYGPGVRGLRQHARPEGHRPSGRRDDPRAGSPGTGRPRLGRSGPDRRPGRLLRRRRGQPAGPVRPGGRRHPPWRRGHHDDGRPGGSATGGGTPVDGPALL